VLQELFDPVIFGDSDLEAETRAYMFFSQFLTEAEGTLWIC